MFVKFFGYYYRHPKFKNIYIQGFRKMYNIWGYSNSKKNKKPINSFCNRSVVDGKSNTIYMLKVQIEKGVLFLLFPSKIRVV